MSPIRGLSSAEHAELVGRVSIGWTDVQSEVFELFCIASGMPRSRSLAVFFTIKADSAQRDMTLAAAEDALATINPPLYAELKSLIADIGKLAGERNAIVHGMWAMHVPYQHVVPNPFVRHHGKLNTTDFITQMETLKDTLGQLYRRALNLRIAVHGALS